MHSVLRLPTPVFCFLLPSFSPQLCRVSRASITTSSAFPPSESSPQPLQSPPKTKRRRPLSRDQKQFLDSAVRCLFFFPLTPRPLSPSVLILAQASCQPCRRACRDPHIYCSNAAHRQVTSPSSIPNAPYVRPRSLPFLYLLGSPCQTPYSAYRYVSCLDRCSDCLRLGNGDDGQGSCNGMH